MLLSHLRTRALRTRRAVVVSFRVVLVLSRCPKGGRFCLFFVFRVFVDIFSSRGKGRARQTVVKRLSSQNTSKRNTTSALSSSLDCRGKEKEREKGTSRVVLDATMTAAEDVPTRPTEYIFGFFSL